MAPVSGAQAFAQDRAQRVGQPGLELVGRGVALAIEVAVQPADARFVEIDDDVHVLLGDAAHQFGVLANLVLQAPGLRAPRRPRTA